MESPTTGGADVMRNPRRYRDKAGTDLFAFRNRIRRREVLNLISDALIAEHARDPIGRRPDFHTKDLQEVLGYLRAFPSDGRYVACRLEEVDQWGIAVTRPGLVPERVSHVAFDTLDEARHAAFLLRVEQLELSVKEDR